tara:strand:+ start:510 stop:1067 length:558 start_codon:yes stop_codon:yes gene_type:complete
MTKREKNILFAALAVGLVFALTQGYPAIQSQYSARADRIDELQTSLERERRLIEDAQTWSERRAQVLDRGAELTQQLFQDSSIPLVSANIQRLVRDYANETNVSITSTKLAESMETDGWILVEQELTIVTSNQNYILSFLDRIETSSPLLGVSSFSVRRNRNQYAGTITVVGFSRTTPARTGAAD